MTYDMYPNSGNEVMEIEAWVTWQYECPMCHEIDEIGVHEFKQQVATCKCYMCGQPLLVKR